MLLFCLCDTCLFGADCFGFAALYLGNLAVGLPGVALAFSCEALSCWHNREGVAFRLRYDTVNGNNRQLFAAPMKIRIAKPSDTAQVDMTATFVTKETLELTDALKCQGFTGDAGKSAVVGGDAVLLGCSNEPTREQVREAVGSALAAAVRVGARSVAFNVPEGIESLDAGVAMTEAVLLASYRYTTYKKAPERDVTDVVFVVDAKKSLSFKKGMERAQSVMTGVTLARDLVNAPPHDMHPEQLAKTALAIAKASKGRVTAKILDRAACEKLGMDAYLAVAKGSAYPPKFIHLTYKPAKASKQSVAVVGKGITFDSGGLSLKPADAMMTMKCDMGGAAATLGLFASITALAPKLVVHGIIAAAENMPSGTAMRPGDIVRSMNGKTIEILNTDAEGRLTLADALHYATKLDPDVIVDLATLTGACVVALGEEIAGLMSNDDDTATELLAAAERAGEKLWELPLEPRYKPLVESEVADLRNIATNRYGGSLTAGLFLQHFVNDIPWAHMDIAGPAFAERPMASYIGKGGTGYGVRTLVEFVDHLSKSA